MAEGVRKGVHMGTILLALLLKWLTYGQAVGIAAAFVIVNGWVLPRIGGGILLRPHERGKKFSWGIVNFPLAVLLVLLCTPGRPEIAGAAWGILALGDGMSSLIGRRFGRRKLPWNPNKSWIGSACHLGFGGIGGLGVYAWIRPGLGVGEAVGVGVAALAAAWVESLPISVDDNLTGVWTSAAVLALWVVPPVSLGHFADLLLVRLPWALVINGLVGGLAFLGGLVNRAGIVGGLAVGVPLFLLGGPQAYVVLLAFFFLASGVTKFGYARKQALGKAQEGRGRRGARNAVANCLVAVLCAYSALVWSWGAFLAAMVAALATACADTLGSELGMLWGRQTFLPTTFKPVPPGTEGAVSLEGTLAGTAGAALLAVVAAALGVIPWWQVGIVVAAATLGAFLESYYGAWFEKTPMDNEVANFLNTLLGAALAFGGVTLVFLTA